MGRRHISRPTFVVIALVDRRRSSRSSEEGLAMQPHVFTALPAAIVLVSGCAACTLRIAQDRTFKARRSPLAAANNLAK